MEANRDRLMEHFQAECLFADVELIRQKCGSNLRYLRKLATIQKNGYFRDPEYMARLVALNDSQGWGLNIRDGKIVVTDDTVDKILSLLNNDLLNSPVNDERFEVSVKRRL